MTRTKKPRTSTSSETGTTNAIMERTATVTSGTLRAVTAAKKQTHTPNHDQKEATMQAPDQTTEQSADQTAENTPIEHVFSCRSADTGVFLAVRRASVDIRANDLLITTVFRQTFVNDTERPLEVVYIFPTAWGSMVSRFAATLGGEELVAKALSLPTAKDTYEEALKKGDAAAHLSVTREGLAVATFANLLPGEELTLEVESVARTTWCDGTVRIRVPVVVDARFDADGSAGGLPPEAVPVTDLAASYPLTIRATLSGALTHGRISMPSHPGAKIVRVTGEGAEHAEGEEKDEGKGEECGSVRIEQKGALDRDVVIRIDRLMPSGYAAVIPSRFHPWPLAVTRRDVPSTRSGEPLRLIVLADCSGSMEGLSIRQLRKALMTLPGLLLADDEIGLIAFGTEARHLQCFRPVRSCKSQWRTIVSQLEADMGGTMFDRAFRAALFGFAVRRTWDENGDAYVRDPFNAHMRVPNGEREVLLITDGEVYGVEARLKALAATGLRAHVLGVGTAPGDTLLSRLAQATRGSCRFVLPSEDAAPALAHLVNAARQDPPVDGDFPGTSVNRIMMVPDRKVKLDSTDLPDACPMTVSLLDALPTNPRDPLAHTWDHLEAAREIQRMKVMREVKLTPEDADRLARFAVFEHVTGTGSRDERAVLEAENLAVEANLLTLRTALVLVKARAEDEKPTVLPTTAVVPQMAVAGRDYLAAVCRAPAVGGPALGCLTGLSVNTSVDRDVEFDAHPGIDPAVDAPKGPVMFDGLFRPQGLDDANGGDDDGDASDGSDGSDGSDDAIFDAVLVDRTTLRHRLVRRKRPGDDFTRCQILDPRFVYGNPALEKLVGQLWGLYGNRAEVVEGHFPSAEEVIRRLIATREVFRWWKMNPMNDDHIEFLREDLITLFGTTFTSWLWNDPTGQVGPGVSFVERFAALVLQAAGMVDREKFDNVDRPEIEALEEKAERVLLRVGGYLLEEEFRPVAAKRFAAVDEPTVTIH